MPSISRRGIFALAGGALATPFVSKLGSAAAWPSKPIRVIVPFSAGSTTDLVGRIVMENVGAQFGQPVVIENRGGAGGTIGANIALQAPADGYTLLVHSSAHSAAPAAYPRTPYSPAKDLRGVASFGSVPNVVVISPTKNIKSLKELAAAGKKGNMTFASAGIGSASHWAAERFRLAAGFDGTHIPFRGGPEGLTEILAGRVDFMCIGVSSGMPFIRDGRLLALGVTTPRRSSALPDVPTTIEAGYPNSDFTFWNGLLASAKTPTPIIDQLHKAVAKALEAPEVKARFGPQGIEPMAVTPEEFDAVIRGEIESNLAIVKAANLKFM